MTTERRAYRPSNGSEGAAFEAKFCRRCEHVDGCDIVAAAYVFFEDESGYPSEWVEDDERGPHCTAFQQRGGAVEKSYRCPNTVDLFDTEGA